MPASRLRGGQRELPVGCRFKCYHPDSRRKFAASADEKSLSKWSAATVKMFSDAKRRNSGTDAVKYGLHQFRGA